MISPARSACGMRIKMSKKNKNYLDYIPVHSANFPWEVNKQGLVEIRVTNKGFYNWLAQKFFHKPRVSRISLEEYGSFIWQQIDGHKSIYDIGLLVREEFGEKAEPVFERLARYFRTLENTHYIRFVK